MKYWYAVMMDREDTDWGTGSFDLDEAKAKVRAMGGDAYIAVIDGGYDDAGNATTDPVCVEQISQDEF